MSPAIQHRCAVTLAGSTHSSVAKLCSRPTAIMRSPALQLATGCTGPRSGEQPIPHRHFAARPKLELTPDNGCLITGEYPRDSRSAWCSRQASFTYIGTSQQDTPGQWPAIMRSINARIRPQSSRQSIIKYLFMLAYWPSFARLGRFRPCC